MGMAGQIDGLLVTRSASCSSGNRELIRKSSRLFILSSAPFAQALTPKGFQGSMHGATFVRRAIDLPFGGPHLDPNASPKLRCIESKTSGQAWCGASPMNSASEARSRHNHQRRRLRSSKAPLHRIALPRGVTYYTMLLHSASRARLSAIHFLRIPSVIASALHRMAWTAHSRIMVAVPPICRSLSP